MLLPEIGEDGQQKLKQAKVLIVGVGGLGSPIALYLTGAGVGCIGLVDDDVVSISNLQRQVLYSEKELGKPKAICAAERGDYGGSKGPVMHGPIFPVDADYPDIVSLGVSADMLALVDAKARRLGVGRDDVIRHAIARDLVDA